MFTMHVNRRCESIFASRVVRELRVIPDPTVADGVPLPPAVPIVVEEKKKKGPQYLPGERLLKKLNKDRDSKARQVKKKAKVIHDLGEDDVERLASSVTSVLASLKIQ